MGSFVVEPDTLQLLYKDFYRSKLNFVSELKKAIEEEDFNGAYIMSHTLKGGSALIGEPTLSSLAHQAEIKFNARTVCWDSISKMTDELEIVMDRLSLIEDSQDSLDASPQITGSEAVEILNKAETLLQTRDTSVKTLLPDIKRIPQSHALVELIEDYDFSNALEVLQSVRNYTLNS